MFLYICNTANSRLYIAALNSILLSFYVFAATPLRKKEVNVTNYKNNIPVVTGLIITFNIAAYIVVMLLGKDNLFDISTMTSYYYGGLEGGGSFIKVFSSMFMHADITHILFNMYALFWLGLIGENILGKFFFAVSYVFTGICGGLAVIWFSPEQVITVGASGAIFGLMGVLCTYGFLIKAPWRHALMNPVLINVGFTVFSMISGGSISAQGHFGGLISGMIIGFIIYTHEHKKPLDFYEYQEQNFGNDVYLDTYNNVVDVEEISLAQQSRAKRQKRSLQGGIAVILITGIVAFSAMGYSVKSNESQMQFYDYVDQIREIVNDYGDNVDGYNKQIAGATTMTTDDNLYVTLKRDYIPVMEKLVEKAAKVKPGNSELKEINKFLLNELDSQLKCYQSLINAYETGDGTYIDTANDYLKKATEYDEKFAEALDAAANG
jgi:membrane associated rhomboid family serine protease